MSMRDARLTLDSLRQQSEEGLRALGQIMVDLWSSKPQKLNNWWVLPNDGPSEHEQTANNLFERQRELNKQRQQNGGN